MDMSVTLAPTVDYLVGVIEKAFYNLEELTSLEEPTSKQLVMIGKHSQTLWLLVVQNQLPEKVVEALGGDMIQRIHYWRKLGYSEFMSRLTS